LEFESAIAEDRKRIVDGQRNFAFVSGGQADWLDLLRPFAGSFTGFRRGAPVGPVTRWFRTNTFYRKPSVVGKIGCTGNELAAALPPVEKGAATMLGPYSFSRMVADEFYASPRELALGYSAAVAKNLAALGGRGYRCLILSEPCVGYDQSKGGFKAPEWIDECVSLLKAGGFTLGIHFPLAEACEALKAFDSAPADFFGIDCIYSEPDGIKTGKGLLLGVVDGARAKVEGAQEIAARAAEFVARAEFSGRYYLGCNDRLFDVPFGIALEKIRRLSECGGAKG
jgi:methionine synthase II (cobalamin-independent)